jgi:hypothetical protein
MLARTPASPSSPRCAPVLVAICACALKRGGKRMGMGLHAG